MERIWGKIAKVGMVAGFVAGGISGVGGAYTLNELNNKLQEQDKKLQDLKERHTKHEKDVGVVQSAVCGNENILKGLFNDIYGSSFPALGLEDCEKEQKEWDGVYRGQPTPTPDPDLKRSRK